MIPYRKCGQRIICCIACTLILFRTGADSLHAQASASTASSASIDDTLADARAQLSAMLSKYVSPNGGAWNATLHFTVVEQNAQQSDQIIKIAGPRNIQRNITRSGNTLTSVTSGEGGQIVRNGKQEVIPTWIANSAKLSEFPFPVIADRLIDPQTKVERITDVTDGDLIHLLITRVAPDGQPLQHVEERRIYESDLYFEKTSEHLVKERHWIFSPYSATNSAQVEVTYSDYRSVDGIDVPYRIQKRLGSVVLSDASLVSIDLRSSNPAAIF